MKISTKLSIGTGAIMLVVLGVILYLFWIVSVSLQLMGVANAAQNLVIAKNQTTVSMHETLSTRGPLADAVDQLTESQRSAEQRITELQEHEGVKHLSASARNAVGRVTSIATLVHEDFVVEAAAVQEVVEAQLPGSPATDGLLRLANRLRRSDVEGSEDAYLYVSSVARDVDRAIQSHADFVSEALVEVAEGISIEARARTSAAQQFAAGLTIAVVIIAFVLIRVFSRGFAKRITHMEAIMSAVASRDLTLSVNPKGSDEIAALGTHLDAVLASLREFFHGVARAVGKADELKDTVSSSSEQTASALNEITKNIENINTRVQTLDQSVGTASEAGVSIAQEVKNLGEDIDTQAESINSASSSIEEMNASVGNVAKLASDRRDRADQLSETVRDGTEKIEGTNEAIRSISHDVDDVLEIIEIINNVSEQTNLLSMNAAIESAHAGEAGRGFAVVAEEIRKLAASTSENAGQIDNTLRSITSKIHEALRSSDVSSTTMNEIQKEMTSFSHAMQEIASNMQELSGGSQEILQSTQQISEFTRRVQAGSRTMAERTDDVKNAMEEARNISAEVSQGVTEIDRGAKEILDSISQVREASAESRDHMQLLSQLMKTFQFERPDDSPENELTHDNSRDDDSPRTGNDDALPRRSAQA